MAMCTYVDVCEHANVGPMNLCICMYVHVVHVHVVHVHMYTCVSSF